MKKLIMAAAALTAGFVVMADDSIVSSTVVGYGKEDSRGGYNYVIPIFRTLNKDSKSTDDNDIKENTDIQQLQLSSDISSYEVTFQFLTARRRNAHTYNWIASEDVAEFASDWSSGQGLWIDDETGEFPEETVNVAVGNAIQLDMGEYDSTKLTFSGQVSDADLSYKTRAGYNYVGNPYPKAMDIQNIQLSSNLSSFEVTFQFLTAKRRNAHTYDWIAAEDVSEYVSNWEEGLGLWIDDATNGFPKETVTIAPGGAVQLDMGEYDGEIVNVYAPIELF